MAKKKAKGIDDDQPKENVEAGGRSDTQSEGGATAPVSPGVPAVGRAGSGNADASGTPTTLVANEADGEEIHIHHVHGALPGACEKCGQFGCDDLHIAARFHRTVKLNGMAYPQEVWVFVPAKIDAVFLMGAEVQEI